ncbi:2-succinyl-6-hydroxy-2,4-cyclohexadiene-1-carboxylate synthase [Vibrio makurazakiensis]|uniref:2-succinyl-6-hydroxy-2, 4-cyclohexadiene-1-carboxylate synthase n=1 Tax=Vibrio makurazakiensis TaxID=2910250 RepID=UPI003D0BC2B0
MLSSIRQPAVSEHSQAPLLVFLHGLLGTGEDWKECADLLPNFHKIMIDLPGHGESRFVDTEGFDESCKMIKRTVEQQMSLLNLSAQHPVIVVGYSLGGRLAMYSLAHGYFDSLNLIKLVVEAGNFGLETEEEKAQRLVNDTKWAIRFAQHPIDEVLSDWYQQSVFSSLNHEQRQTLVLKRSGNLGVSVANMLLSTSLAKQPDLRATLNAYQHLIHYVCGKKDQKFIDLATLSGFEFSEVDFAGHNVHFEQPEQFSDVIKQQSNV